MNDQPHLTTGAEAMVHCFVEAEMPAIFGVPGGGSSLDIIAAAKAAGIPFVLARTENGAGIMASALAELTHKPVGLLTTRGPGVSNAANGMANAALERAPVILIADGFAVRESGYVTHQLFDQVAMMAPVTRAQGIGAGEAARVIAQAEDIVLTDGHWEVIRYLREQFREHGHTPNFRSMLKGMAEIRPDIDSKALYDLFPIGPAKQGPKVAGLPQPLGKGGY